MKTPTFCICENKGADQHRSICEADQRLCFRCTEVAVIRKSHHNNSECTCSMFIRCGIMPKFYQKVQVGKDQEKTQSEKDSHSKNRGGKKPNYQSGTYTMKHIVSRMSSYFPNRWPLSYLNLTKNMKTYIRRQQHKKKCLYTKT